MRHLFLKRNLYLFRDAPVLLGYELEQISRLQVLLLSREIECASTIGILDDEMLIVEIIQGIKSAKIREPVPIELKTSLEIAVQIIDQHTAIGPIPHEYLPFLVIQIDTARCGILLVPLPFPIDMPNSLTFPVINKDITIDGPHISYDHHILPNRLQPA